MAITPLEIQKMRFSQKMRGYDPTEVEGFLALLAEELSNRIAQADKLERENRYYRQRLEETEHREHQLQQTLLRAQKVSDDITANARREAELTVKEAEMAADKIVQQAIEQSTRFEAKITELRTARRELQLKFKNTLDLFERVDRGDARMRQRRGRPRLALQPGPADGVRAAAADRLQGDGAAEPRVAGEIHDAHAATADLALDFVGPDDAADQQRG